MFKFIFVILCFLLHTFELKADKTVGKSLPCEPVNLESRIVNASPAKLEKDLKDSKIDPIKVSTTLNAIQTKAEALVATKEKKSRAIKKIAGHIRDKAVTFYKEKSERYGKWYAMVIVGMGIVAEILIPVPPGTFFIGAGIPIGLAEAFIKIRGSFSLDDDLPKDLDASSFSYQQLFSDVLAFQKEILEYARSIEVEDDFDYAPAVEPPVVKPGI